LEARPDIPARGPLRSGAGPGRTGLGTTDRTHCLAPSEVGPAAASADASLRRPRTTAMLGTCL
ncbi:MAG: hypothetical protein VYC34_02785, partial [Planctomycetota bacterium]|nr:hypothetical protein [Planctomycetota bacterium]